MAANEELQSLEGNVERAQQKVDVCLQKTQAVRTALKELEDQHGTVADILQRIQADRGAIRVAYDAMDKVTEDRQQKEEEVQELKLHTRRLEQKLTNEDNSESRASKYVRNVGKIGQSRDNQKLIEFSAALELSLIHI